MLANLLSDETGGMYGKRMLIGTIFWVPHHTMLCFNTQRVNICSELHHRPPLGSAFSQLEVQRLCLIKDEIYTGNHFRFLPELTSKQQVL